MFGVVSQKGTGIGVFSSGLFSADMLCDLRWVTSLSGTLFPYPHILPAHLSTHSLTCWLTHLSIPSICKYCLRIYHLLNGRAKSLQSCPPLCNPMDCSPWTGSFIHGILQARTLEWVAVPSSRGSSRLRDWTHVSYISCIGRQVLYH